MSVGLGNGFWLKYLWAGWAGLGVYGLLGHLWLLGLDAGVPPPELRAVFFQKELPVAPVGSALLGPMLGRASKSPDSRLRGFPFSAQICLICLGDAHSRLSGHLPGSCCWPCWSGPAHPSLHASCAPHVSLSLCLSHLWGPPEGRDCVSSVWVLSVSTGPVQSSPQVTSLNPGFKPRSA